MRRNAPVSADGGQHPRRQIPSVRRLIFGVYVTVAALTILLGVVGFLAVEFGIPLVERIQWIVTQGPMHAKSALSRDWRIVPAILVVGLFIVCIPYSALGMAFVDFFDGVFSAGDTRREPVAERHERGRPISSANSARADATNNIIRRRAVTQRRRRK